MTDHIAIDLSDRILTLTMTRPEKKNALTDRMYEILADQLNAAQTDPQVRAVVVQGDGDMFCAGNDVSDFAATATRGDGPRNVTRFLKAIAHATKPLVAAVQGRAVGVGATMLLHCDHVVLAENALLSTPFVNLALVPEAASSLLLPARIGHVRAYSMFAVGEAVSAQDALSWGLANRVVALGEEREAARAFALKLADQPIGALMATKKLMRNGDVIAATMDVEGVEFGARLTSPEAQEAFMAFAMRRKPDFSPF
jgi:enoyl-CoA hydratase/carnithine racemase